MSDATTAAYARAARERLRAWVGAAAITALFVGLARRGARTRDAVGAAAATALPARAARTLARWVRHSSLYRWLTADPDPDVIVIDLRETYTVGPLVALLDRLVPPVARAWHRSRLHRELGAVLFDLRSAPIRVVSIAACAAILANVAVRTITGAVSTGGLLVRLGLLIGALLGTQVRTPWVRLREVRAVRLLVAALSPPDPPADGRDRERR